MALTSHRRQRDEARQALQAFDPLLVQLVRDDAPLRVILSEGFNVFELRAVRTLTGRADATNDPGPVGAETSRHAVTVSQETLLAH